MKPIFAPSMSDRFNCMRRILAALVLMTFSGTSFCQYKMLLLNGTEKNIVSYQVKPEWIKYTIFKKNNPSKTVHRTVDRFRVFSITDSIGREDMIYMPDTSEGVDYTIEEMRIFIQGEQAAQLYYDKPANRYSAVVIGGASSLMTFYGIPVPVIYAAVLGKFTPQYQVPAGVAIPNSGSEIFREGYKRKARDMKLRETLEFGGIGFAVSFAALAVILSNSD